MADVDRGGKARPQGGRTQRAQAIDQQTATGWVAITSRLGAIEVLQRADHVEQAHRNDHPQPRHQIPPGLPQPSELNHRRLPTHQRPALLPGARRHLHQPAAPGEHQPQQQGEQTGWQRPAHTAVVTQQNHRQTRQTHQRVGVGAQQKAKRDVAQGNPGEGGEQRRPRQPQPQLVGAKGTGGFNQARAEAGHHAGLPGAGDGGALIQPCPQSGELDRQHHQKDVGEQAHGVDAIGQRRAVLAPFLKLQNTGLAGVSQIAQQQADAGGRQDHPKHQAVGVAQHIPAQSNDQQDRDQVVEG